MKKIIFLPILILCSLLFTPSTYGASGVSATWTSAAFYLESSTSSEYTQGIMVDGVRYFTLSALATALKDTPSKFSFKWVPALKHIEIEKGTAYTGTPSTNTSSAYSIDSVKPTHATLQLNGKTHVIKAFSYNNQSYFNPNDLAPLLACRFTSKPNSYTIGVYPDLAYRQVQDGTTSDTYTLNFSLPTSSNRWASPLLSSAFVDQNNVIHTVNLSKALYMTTYDANLKPLITQTVPKDLPLWGGFYNGSRYNFCVTGQNNKEQNNSKEVIRIVKYDKDLKPIDTLSITGGMCFTTNPFDAGSLRMQEIGNKLIIHTSRERYKSSDGLNHQSQLTLIIDIDSMKLVNDLGLFQPNHVSHSFNQFVLKDGSKHILLDHGDAYPRSIVLHAQKDSGYQEVDLFDIPGKTGANATGVSIGGFEMSDSHYLAAFSTIDHSLATSYNSYTIVGAEADQRHIMVSAVPKNNLSSSAVKQQMIINYTGTSKTASSPYLVKLSTEHLALLWQENDSTLSYDMIRYVCLDAKGNPCTPVGTLYGTLSTCAPILYNNTITWFAKHQDAQLVYQVPLDMILPN